MSYLIRHFRNTDPPHLARIWNRHYEAWSTDGPVSAAVIDACVLGKPFFQPTQLWIAEDDHQAVGFIHLGYGGNEAHSDLDPHQPLINALCIEPHLHEGVIAELLLEKALSSLPADSTDSVIALGAPDRYAFYLGMAPGDGLMGVVARDQRVQRWLGNHGFLPVRPTECWELDLATFRPPMDRSQFSVRRESTVVRLLEESHGQWWNAVVLGHTEQVRFQLYSRAGATITHEVTFWYTDQTWSRLSSNMVRLWQLDFPKDDDGRDRLIYLLAEAFRHLHSERFTRVRVVSSADQIASTSVLQRLGFRSVDSGLIYEYAKNRRH